MPHPGFCESHFRPTDVVNKGREKALEIHALLKPKFKSGKENTSTDVSTFFFPNGPSAVCDLLFCTPSRPDKD